MRIPLSTARAFIAGDEAATAEVYLDCRKLLYFIIRSIVTNPEDAADVYQDVFVSVLKNRSAITSPSHLVSYLARTAENMALNFAKRQGALVDYSDLMDAYGTEEHQNAYLQEFIPFLSDLENAVLVYKLEYGFTFREIAVLTGVSRQTADVAYKAAIRKIRKNLGGSTHVRKKES